MGVLAQIGLVAFGSALGGLLRWGVGVAFGRWFGIAFPWGTLFINVTGCLFLGWFATYLGERIGREHAWLSRDDLRLLWAIGFTGAYTTFSTYEYEAHALLTDGFGFKGMTYLIGSVVLGLIAVRCGVMLAGGPK